ncbi:ORF6N domain-containing protein [Dysgonomonas alginatilytica]|uniref:ORF6N domain-containing protein n=1 Tax=Dysgonomonas alginatilytica TaxID=1605892 RepID=A0A2V3PVB3_9BACT|nr:ORF6N domain-containing protein [Dysgonomonas alginatilytica]PXV68744.1 ORF6N domain-containing protein [Dysgonomonas alginatilytica]
MELQVIQNKIFEVRGLRVMVDFHLAELYDVKTKVLKQAVKRNVLRFPSDFMFELTDNEWSELVTNCDRLPKTLKHSSVNPMVFTESGVAMLSSVLRSEIAIEVNISIMRAFVATRKYLADYSSISKEIENLWKHLRTLETYSEENLKAINDLSEDNQNAFDEIYIALSELANKQNKIESKPRKRVGYVQDDIE